ncbi:MAG: TMEM165/GDT1 family protein [Kiritimatiellia bacterium]
MNWQIFFSTFILIFLAELGDKTQLAVMVQSAGVAGKWTVFLAGSLALILATAIGVLAGGICRKFVSDLNVIRACGGVMFLVFGILMLVDVIRGGDEKFSAREFTAPDDWMSRHVIQHAAAFEEAATLRYNELAAKEPDTAKRKLYEWLAAEEKSHLEAMKLGLNFSEEDEHIAVSEAMIADLPPIAKMYIVCDPQERTSRSKILAAVESEKAQVQFYEALAEHCKIPRLKNTFHALAGAEQLHADKLTSLLGEECYGRVD